MADKEREKLSDKLNKEVHYKIEKLYNTYDPTDFISTNKEIVFKYNEDILLEEIKDYIASTYKKHYAGENGVQSVDLIESAGHIEGFYLGNIIKYGGRYGRKNGKNRNDLLKIIHYAILSLYIHDKYNAEAQVSAKVLHPQ